MFERYKSSDYINES